MLGFRAEQNYDWIVRLGACQTESGLSGRNLRGLCTRMEGTLTAPHRTPQRPPVVGPRVGLARYTISSGERVLYGQRVDGNARLIDRPAWAPATQFLVEPHMERDDRKALHALIEDYVEQAQHHDQVPMLLNPPTPPK